VDILSACNLVNYFGKMVLGGSGVGQITLHPILIRKVCQCILLTSDMEDLSLFVVTDNS
jgi:double-strand break repair protein MRE11